MGHLAHSIWLRNGTGFDSMVAMENEHTEHGIHRSLEVTNREALALLAALEISPFEDEVLEQKLLNLIYSSQSHSFRRRPRDTRHFIHQRRNVG